MQRKRTLGLAEQLSQPSSKRKADFVFVGPRQDIARHHRYNPVSPDGQRQTCDRLGLRFVSENGCVPGGPDTPLRHPVLGKKMQGDGIVCFALSAMLLRVN